MDERLRFVARLLDGEKMAVLCREFDISRKTGYKIFTRYKDCGLEGLTDRSRRPYRNANQLPVSDREADRAAEAGAPELGSAKDPGEAAAVTSRCTDPSDQHRARGARSTWAGEAAPARAATRPKGPRSSTPQRPNDLWCADYKGEFMLADKRYCYPLTISDFASRYLISCDALSTTKETYAFTVFERAFKDFGLPKGIRTDNGVPFASPHSLFGLSKLSVWWLRLGIRIERIKPGHPQQNGRHERMHLTLKKEATKPAAKNFLQQQAKFDDFIECYNRERPHQALNMQYPAELYEPSPRPYRGLIELEYPFHDKTITVTQCGRICFGRQKINLSQVFAGQNVGVKQISDRIWLVSFMDYDLGFFDDETCRLESAGNPFEPKVLPMSPV